MSQWTHVAGCIRLDDLRLWKPDPDLPALVQAGLPNGSEGPLQFHVWVNPERNHISAYTISLWGDLRDFGTEDVPGLVEWFKRIASSTLGIRQAMLHVVVEYGPTIILHHTENEVQPWVEQWFQYQEQED
jgi:hypothetical protein